MTHATIPTIDTQPPRRGSTGRSPGATLCVGLLMLAVGGPAAAEHHEREAARSERPETGQRHATAPRIDREASPETARDAQEGWSPALYVPPSRGQARHTAAGGTRGSARTGSLELAVLAPSDHVALTTLAQPKLYWYVSESVVTRIDVTLVDDQAIDPLLELTLPTPVGPGIHELDLAAHGITLETGRVYSWHVALVRDEARRSSDLLTEGFIERRPDAHPSAHGSDRAIADLAGSGYWYDAIERLRAEIAARPQDARLRRQQAALLEQVELGGVAQHVQ